MGEQATSWYIPGEGKQPAGPFTAEQLIQSWRAGRLDASTICWREGMSQWLPLSQVEPFASAIVSARLPRQSTAGTARSPASRAGAPSSPPGRSQPVRRRRLPPAWIGWVIGGGLVAICALVAGVVFLLDARTTVNGPGAPGSEDSASQNWGDPVRIEIVGENQEVLTTFLVGLKDAWCSNCEPSGGNGKNTFVVVYYYKNLGPREELEPLARGDVRKEIRTDKGHIFPGGSLSGGPQALFALPEAKRAVFWWAKQARKIEEAGESALVFAIPKDEVPTEVIVGGRIASGRIDLDLKLPQGCSGFRIYSGAFGFLPQKPEKAVPVFVEALQDKDQNMRRAALDALGAIGPAAKEAVPAITNVLLDDDRKRGDMCIAAAGALGRIGPAASVSIPTLNRFRQRSPLLKGLAYVGLRRAIYEALENIGSAKDATVTIIEDLNSGDILASAEAFDELVKLASTVPETVLAIADVVSDKTQEWHRRIDAAKFLGNLGPKAKKAIPDLKKTLRELEQMGERRWSSDDELLASIKEGLPKIDQNWESVPVAKPRPTLPPPQGYNRFAHDVPPGLREGINRLAHGLQERNDLTGNFSDYQLIVPPDYKGDETKYEIGFLHPGGTFYVFRTVDGGQTWSPLPPTNPYLIKIGNDEVERVRGKSRGVAQAKERPTGGPMAKVPQRPGDSGRPEVTGAHVFITGIVEIDGARQVWLQDRAAGKQWKLKEGENFQIGEANGKVLTFPSAHEVIVDFGGRHGRFREGDNLRGGVDEAPEKIGDAEASVSALSSGAMPRHSAEAGVAEVTPHVDENPLPKGPLSGTWQASGGWRFRIDDDGNAATIELTSSSVFKSVTGKLARAGGDPNSKSLKGTFEIVPEKGPERYHSGATATLDDANKHLNLKCENWPKWLNGRLVRDKLTETLTRE